MTSASREAEEPPQGQNGTRVRLYWKGLLGITWNQLVPMLHNLMLSWPYPDLLIIHVGEINLNKPEELLGSIKKELISIRKTFPQCLIVWSDILPRYHWKSGPRNPPDQTYHMINSTVHAMMAELGGTTVSHDNIGPELFSKDGIQLSQHGILRFCTNIQWFVDKWEKVVDPKSEDTDKVLKSPDRNSGRREPANRSLPPSSRSRRSRKNRPAAVASSSNTGTESADRTGTTGTTCSLREPGVHGLICSVYSKRTQTRWCV